MRESVGVVPALCVAGQKVLDVADDGVHLAVLQNDAVRRSRLLEALIGPVARSVAGGAEAKQGELSRLGTVTGLIAVGAPLECDGAKLLQGVWVLSGDDDGAVQVGREGIGQRQAVGPVVKDDELVSEVELCEAQTELVAANGRVVLLLERAGRQAVQVMYGGRVGGGGGARLGVGVGGMRGVGSGVGVRVGVRVGVGEICRGVAVIGAVPQGGEMAGCMSQRDGDAVAAFFDARDLVVGGEVVREAIGRGYLLVEIDGVLGGVAQQGGVERARAVGHLDEGGDGGQAVLLGDVGREEIVAMDGDGGQGGGVGLAGGGLGQVDCVVGVQHGGGRVVG